MVIYRRQQTNKKHVQHFIKYVHHLSVTAKIFKLHYYFKFIYLLQLFGHKRRHLPTFLRWPHFQNYSIWNQTTPNNSSFFCMWGIWLMNELKRRGRRRKTKNVDYIPPIIVSVTCREKYLGRFAQFVFFSALVVDSSSWRWHCRCSPFPVLTAHK